MELPWTVLEIPLLKGWEFRMGMGFSGNNPQRQAALQTSLPFLPKIHNQ